MRCAVWRGLPHELKKEVNFFIEYFFGGLVVVGDQVLQKFEAQLEYQLSLFVSLK